MIFTTCIHFQNFWVGEGECVGGGGGGGGGQDNWTKVIDPISGPSLI